MLDCPSEHLTKTARKLKNRNNLLMKLDRVPTPRPSRRLPSLFATLWQSIVPQFGHILLTLGWLMYSWTLPCISSLVQQWFDAYRQYHSTDCCTWVYTVQWYVTCSRQWTGDCPVLIGLNGGFWHELLMLHLEQQFSIHDVTLEWFRSCLQGRSFCVIYVFHVGYDSHCLLCAARIGSWSRLFILYKVDLAEVLQKHNVNIHVFADDTQLYCHCLSDKMSATTVQLERCLAEVIHWMSVNRLKLNPDKTELLLAGSKYSQSSLGSMGLSLEIDSDTVMASDHVRVLDVTSFDKYVSGVRAACFYWLRQLRRVRRSLNNEDACPCLCHSLGGLLQHGTHWCTDVCHWQTAAGIERCCMSCQWNAQVQSWTVADLCYMPTCTGSMW